MKQVPKKHNSLLERLKVGDTVWRLPTWCTSDSGAPEKGMVVEILLKEGAVIVYADREATYWEVDTIYTSLSDALVSLELVLTKQVKERIEELRKHLT